MKIEDIPTAQWNRILEALLQNGWRKTYQYDAFDAGIDYDEIHLRKAGQNVQLLWNNWTEGEILAEREIDEVRAIFLLQSSPNPQI